VSHYDEIDTVYSTMDGLFRAGRFHIADQILAVVDAEIEPVVLLAYVSISACARHLLPSRSALVSRARERCLRDFGEERTAGLFRGFDA
jgi:hypothetical protein